MGDMHEYIPGCERTGDRSVRYRADDFVTLFKFFLLSSTLSMTAHGLGVLN
jgi:D-aminopeptidase